MKSYIDELTRVHILLGELCYYFELIEPKLIVCDGEVISKVTESLKSVPIDPMIYAFSNASDPIRSTADFFKGFETEPSTFQLVN